MLPANLRNSFRITPAHWLTYIITYFVVGTTMNQVGQWLEIARFTYWWQVITCYLLFMLPISLVIRSLPAWQQYVLGLLPMGLCELGGYALHTSYAYPGNIIDRFLDARNFSLVMTLVFAAYFPLLNALVAFLYRFVAPAAAAPSSNRAAPQER